MAELKLERVQTFQVTEIGFVGRRVSHGLFSSKEEADERYRQVLERQPGLRATGSLYVEERTVETVEPVTAGQGVGR